MSLVCWKHYGRRRPRLYLRKVQQNKRKQTSKPPSRHDQLWLKRRTRCGAEQVAAYVNADEVTALSASISRGGMPTCTQLAVCGCTNHSAMSDSRLCSCAKRDLGAVWSWGFLSLLSDSGVRSCPEACGLKTAKAWPSRLARARVAPHRHARSACNLGSANS